MYSYNTQQTRPALGESIQLDSAERQYPVALEGTTTGWADRCHDGYRGHLTLAIQRAIASRGSRTPALPDSAFDSSSRQTIQRAISDEDPVGVGPWNQERAEAYFQLHNLQAAVIADLDLKGVKQDFIKPLILAKIIELGDAEAEFDQSEVTLKARETAQYMADQAGAITEAHTFESDGPQADFWMYARDPDMYKAWGKLMLGRLTRLINPPNEAAIPEIKDLIRRTTAFDQESEHFSILRQMAQMLATHPNKDQFAADFEHVLGSAFVKSTDRDDNRHRIDAMVEVGDAILSGPQKSAFAIKMMAEVRHLTSGIEDFAALPLTLELTLLKVRKSLVSQGFNGDNVIPKSVELGFVAEDQPLITRVLALDPKAFIVKRFLSSQNDTAAFKRIARYLEEEGLQAIASPADLTTEQFEALKQKIKVGAERDQQGESLADSSVIDIRASYHQILQAILDLDDGASLEDHEIFGAQSGDFLPQFRRIFYYAKGALYQGDGPVSKETLLEVKEALIAKDVDSTEDHIKDHWYKREDELETYQGLLDAIGDLDLDPDRLVAAMPEISPDQIQEVGISLDKSFFASVMGGIVEDDVDLSTGYLMALQDAEGDKLVRLAYFLRFVPKSELLEEYKTLFNEHPEHIEALNQKLFTITKIDLNAGGGITALSAPISRVLLEAVSFPGHADKWKASAESVKTKLGENHHLDVLDAEYQELLDHVHEKTLGTDVFTLGRTVIFPKGGNAIAVKLLKQGESLGEFQKELAMQKYLAEKKAELGLMSDYPKAIGTFTVEEVTFDRLQQHIINGMAATKLKAVTDQEPAVKDIALEEGDTKCTVMLYTAPKNYFLYQNQAGLSSDAFRGELPALSEETLTSGREKFFEDAMILLREGIGFPQLIDLNHNSERIYNWMIDVSRVFDSSLQGMGKISNWKTAARYPNMRASGLADLGDMALLDEVQVDYTSKDSTNEQESSSGKIWSLQAQQKHKMFTAQYLGTYVLSSILTEAHGFFVTQKMQRVGAGALDSEALDDAVPILESRLAHVFKTAFKTFTKTFRDVDNADALYGNIIKPKDVKELADQMVFIMSGEYVSHLGADMLTGDLEDYELADEAGTSFKDRLDELSPDKAIEAMKPLKDQQASAGYARQALGAHGIYTIPINRPGDDWVKKPDIEQDTEADPTHAFAVDLGFVNGPQPIPKLQDILYKLVTYAMLNISK